MYRFALAIGLAAVLALPSSAQDRPLSRFGVQATVGTTGIGGSVVTNLVPRVNLRVTGSQFSEGIVEGFGVDIDIREELDGTEFLAENAIDFFQLGAIADVYLLGGLRVSGGLVYAQRDLRTTLSAQEPITEGGRTYQPEEIGAITATGSFGSDLAPYAGIGFGNAAGGGRIGLVFEVGAYYTGAPDVTLVADDPDSVIAPTANPDNELVIEEALGDILGGTLGSDEIYPELRVGLSVRFN